jgi:hypothetical protein
MGRSEQTSLSRDLGIWMWDVEFRIYLMSLEELHRTLVLLGGRATAERTEIAAAPRLWILLARVEPVLS